MRFLTLILAVLLVTLFTISCSTVQPVNATSNELGRKIGKATTTYIFGLPMGNGGILNAAKNGGIVKISTVDKKTTLPIIIPIFWTETTIISGD